MTESDLYQLITQLPEAEDAMIYDDTTVEFVWRGHEYRAQIGPQVFRGRRVISWARQQLRVDLPDGTTEGGGYPPYGDWREFSGVRDLYQQLCALSAAHNNKARREHLARLREAETAPPVTRESTPMKLNDLYILDAIDELIAHPEFKLSTLLSALRHYASIEQMTALLEIDRRTSAGEHEAACAPLNILRSPALPARGPSIEV